MSTTYNYDSTSLSKLPDVSNIRQLYLQMEQYYDVAPAPQFRPIYMLVAS